jgi:orotate phosphoribosyltransferase
MPLTLTEPVLAKIGAALWTLMPPARRVHAIALASGGIGLGIALTHEAPPGLLRSVTVAKRSFGFDCPELSLDNNEHVVVLDNSLHSGRSAMEALTHVRTHNPFSCDVITLFSAANQCEQLARDRLTDLSGIRVLACAPWSERHDWGSTD